MKGYIIVDNGKEVKTYHNAFVESGRVFTLEFLWGISQWVTTTERYAGVGTSMIVDGVNGPKEEGSRLPVTGTTWNPESLKDWKLYSEITQSARPQVSVNRTDRTVEIEVTFTDTEIDTTGGDVDIYEMGFFLDSTPGTAASPSPAGNPIDNSTERSKAMISRIVFYKKTEDAGVWYYEEDPVTKVAGSNLILRYVFIDV